MAGTTPYPLPYILFFHYVEPVCTLAGAIAAALTPQKYLEMTYASPTPGLVTLSTGTHVVLRQLGNLYLAFALNEALVLRATNDLKVWRAFLFVLLVADFGHILSVLPVGASIYYSVNKWGPMDWGNLAFVYLGAATRICFLSGVGLGKAKAQRRQRRSRPMQRVTEGDSAVKGPPTPATNTRRKSAKKS